MKTRPWLVLAPAGACVLVLACVVLMPFGALDVRKLLILFIWAYIAGAILEFRWAGYPLPRMRLACAAILALVLTAAGLLS
jgi:hypothetical protein